MPTYRVAYIPGDGVGPSVLCEGRKVLDAVSEAESFEIEWVEYPFGAEHYLKTGLLVTEEDLKEMKGYDAIYFTAVGDPRVKPGILEPGIILRIRFYFDQYVNLRPVKLFEGVPTPLVGKSPDDIDFVFVRENTEDFYVGLGSRVSRGSTRQELELMRETLNLRFGLDIVSDAEEVAYQIGIISKRGAERVMRYGFKYAEDKGRTRVTCVDKANVITHVYGFWREAFERVSKDFPKISINYNLVDACAMYLVNNPEHYQVLITPNMFGDILSDLGAMLMGGMGMAPCGNINPDSLSMFEPIHGSAPDIVGKTIANPTATIWAGGLLLEAIGEKVAAERVVEALRTVLAEGKVRTVDIGGSSKTWEVGDAVAKRVKQ